MKTIESKIVIGTKVLVNGEWCTVKEIAKHRKHFQTDVWMGSFQRKDIKKYTNKERVWH